MNLLAVKPLMVGFILVFCIALAGCSRAIGPPSMPGTASGGFSQEGAAATSFKVLHNFGAANDGIGPFASLIGENGTFYGTTWLGGAYPAVMGTVFGMKYNGKEKVLHSFGGGSSDGAAPEAGLLKLKNTLYGTTYSGGPTNVGTVFRVSTTGTGEKVLHAFRGTDGRYPRAGLVELKNMLYGTTFQGGSCHAYVGGCGVVFSISPTTGRMRLLHKFGGGKDGQNPYAGLIVVNGMLVGTTQSGGKYGYGTVFTMSTAGTEHVLYSFKGGSDGANPVASVIWVINNRSLYGTTQYGGAKGEGTVFALDLKGGENVIYSFLTNGQYDGDMPLTSLAYVPSNRVTGTLYGTAAYGGADGDGAIYSVSLLGKERVLYSFSGTNQAFPSSLLTDKGAFYGTTQYGGMYGDGTAFRLSIP